MASLASALDLNGTRRLPRLAALPAMGLLLAAMFIVSLGIGSVEISPLQVMGILAKRLVGLDIGATFTEQQELVLWNIRLPRICLGVLAGCGLAAAGAALQGIFRNPLADPGLIGSSSGAAVGAVAMIMLGAAPLGGTFSMPVAAFAGALVLTSLVYVLSRHNGRTEVVTLILTGVALNAIAGAFIGMMIFYATDAQLRSITFWTLGSLGGSTWHIVYATVPFVLIGCGGLMTTRRALNLMILGEREAYHLGISTERLRLLVIGLAALVAGAVVAAIGIIGFVGLMVPHLMRLLLGPDHRTLLPASAIGGAILRRPLRAGAAGATGAAAWYRYGNHRRALFPLAAALHTAHAGRLGLMAPVLETRNVSFSTGKAKLLRDVSIEASSGEVLAVVGPNGAGKSTLLRLLAGELTPSTGEVLIEGKPLKTNHASELALKRAVLPQQTVLQFAFTAREVVLMGRNPHLKDGWPNKDDEHIAQRAMELTETTLFAPRSFPSLSGGEQSRVTLARVLAQEAPLLLLDEPTSSLDMRHQEQVMAVMRRLAAAGACVLVILHDLNLAAAYADRIAVLHKGSLAACDVPAAVLRPELLNEVFEFEFDVVPIETDRPYVLPRRKLVSHEPLCVSGPGVVATPAVSPTAVSPCGITGVATRLANDQGRVEYHS